MKITTDPSWRQVVSAGPPDGFIAHAPVRCLVLDCPAGLYVTDDGLVTHNSPQESLAGVGRGLKTFGRAINPLRSDDLSRGFQNRDLITRELLYGRGGPKMFNSILDGLGWRAKAVKQVGANLKDDVQALTEKRAKTAGLNLDQVQREVNLAMVDPAALAYLKLVDPALGEATRRARNYVDHLTEVSAGILQGQGHQELAAVMMGNTGKYLKRGYALFDPEAGWDWNSLTENAAKGKKMPNGADPQALIDGMVSEVQAELDVAAMKAARALATAQAALSKQQALAQNQSAVKSYRSIPLMQQRVDRLRLRAQEARAAASNPNEAQARVATILTRGSWLGGHGSGAADDKALAATTSFSRRKNISDAFRAGMGEETDALSRYLSSVDFLTQHVERFAAQRIMRDAGIAAGIFSETKSGIYNVEIPGTDLRMPGFAGPMSEPVMSGGVVIKPAAPAPLYTTEANMEALKMTYLQAPITGEGMAMVARHLLQGLRGFEREAKANYVAASIIAPASNFIGGAVGIVQTGAAFNTEHWGKAFRAISTGKNAGSRGINHALLEEARSLMADLQAAGVVDNNVDLRLMARNMAEATGRFVKVMDAHDRKAGFVRGAIMGAVSGNRLAGVEGAVVGAVAGAVGGTALGNERFVQARNVMADYLIARPDNFFKIINFLEEYKTLVAHHKKQGASDQQAHRRAMAEAPEIARNGMPSYDQLAAWARNLASVGVLPTFLAFQYLLFKNSYWNMQRCIVELKSDSTPMRIRGLKRLAGISSIGAMAATGASALASAALVFMGFGRGEEDEEKKRLFRRVLGDQRLKYGDLAFAEISREKIVRLEVDYLIPHVKIMNYFRAASEGKSAEEAGSNFLDELYQQWAGNSVIINPISEAIANDITGRNQKVTEYPEGTKENKIERFAHGMQWMLPSAVRTGGDAARSALGWNPKWDQRTPWDIGKSVLGLRLRSSEGDKTIAGMWAGIAAVGRGGDSLITAGKDTPNRPDSDNKQEIGAETIAKLKSRAEDLRALMARMGYTETEIAKMQTDNGVSAATFETKAETEARTAMQKAARGRQRALDRAIREASR